MTDTRSQQLVSWLNTLYQPNSFQLSPLHGDASFRRYFRLHTAADKTYVVMDAPPPRENCYPFIQLAKAFSMHQVHVPEIFAAHEQMGFLVLSDFGDITLLNIISDDNAEKWYDIACGELYKLMHCKAPKDYELTTFAGQLLFEQCQLSEQWFFATHLKYALSPSEQKTLQAAFHSWIECIAQQPQVCIHRDYHSRNLMVLDEHRLGVIDFQDASLGPIAHDFVSLWRDCYISWPAARITQWLQKALGNLQAQGIVAADVTESEFKKWFDWVGLQRHMRILGTFARLSHRDGKSAYLKDLPLTFRYVLQASRPYPELQDFYHFMQEKIAPRLMTDEALLCKQ